MFPLWKVLNVDFPLYSIKDHRLSRSRHNQVQFFHFNSICFISRVKLIRILGRDVGLGYKGVGIGFGVELEVLEQPGLRFHS